MCRDGDARYSHLPVRAWQLLSSVVRSYGFKDLVVVLTPLFYQSVWLRNSIPQCDRRGKPDFQFKITQCDQVARITQHFVDQSEFFRFKSIKITIAEKERF